MRYWQTYDFTVERDGIERNARIEYLIEGTPRDGSQSIELGRCYELDLDEGPIALTAEEEQSVIEELWDL